MATISEDYVSFETAKLLVKKGLKYSDAEYESYYTIHGIVISFKDRPTDVNIAPRFTLQMAIKWLREVHKVHIIAEPCLGEGFDNNLCFNRWFWTIFKEEGEYKPIRRIDDFPTYEQAVEAAIKYCLENLI